MALGGTAYAANTVGSEDIIDDSVLSQDIRNGQVTRGDIAANAINSSRVADGALTGNDLAQNAVTSSRVANSSLLGDDIAPRPVLRGLALAPGDTPQDGIDFGDGVFLSRATRSGSPIATNEALRAQGLELPVDFPPSTDVRMSAGTDFNGRPQLDLRVQGSTNSGLMRRLHAPSGEQEIGTDLPFSSSSGCTPWRNLNPEVNGPAAFYFDDSDRVYLSGVVTGGTVGCAVFKLPFGVWPCTRHIFPVVSGNAFGRVTVEVNGDVVVNAPSTDSFVSLSGVSFQDQTGLGCS